MKRTFNSRICSCCALHIRIVELIFYTQITNKPWLCNSCTVKMLCWNDCSYHYSFISGSLHWPWLFWEILKDVSVNGQRYIHFYKNKYNKLTPILLIHLFWSPMQASLFLRMNYFFLHFGIFFKGKTFGQAQLILRWSKGCFFLIFDLEISGTVKRHHLTGKICVKNDKATCQQTSHSWHILFGSQNYNLS